MPIGIPKAGPRTSATGIPGRTIFPAGLRPLGDAAHKAGMKFVLWFEPERVAPGTQFDRERPEFLLKTDEAGNRLFDLGNAKARQFLVDFLDGRIKQWGVDVYRQDFNFDPLPFWQKHDAQDRRGITEMLYVEGLYQLWSELLRRNPALTIDNCASGGRRIDLETCSLSYPLWRSDFNDIGEGLKGPAYWPSMARADQVHVTGLALYIPFQSGPLWDMHPYNVRSAMTSSVVLYERILPSDFPAELAKQGIAEIKRLRPLFLGDFYPLLPIGTSQGDWYAYQLDRPDLRQGCVLDVSTSREPRFDARDSLGKHRSGRGVFGRHHRRNLRAGSGKNDARPGTPSLEGANRRPARLGPGAIWSDQSIEASNKATGVLRCLRRPDRLKWAFWLRRARAGRRALASRGVRSYV